MRRSALIGGSAAMAVPVASNVALTAAAASAESAVAKPLAVAIRQTLPAGDGWASVPGPPDRRPPPVTSS